ncbi:MAG: hypothetical protein Q7R33_05205 [Nitrosarchaeum sp.]|nr:hypothetical protein [Nitrosarchaeum sp.]
MKITSLLSSGVLEFNDLGSQIKGVSPEIRDIKLSAGASKYLVETSEVLLSAQSGDIHRFAAASKISVNDRSLALANLGTVVMAHNFGYIPTVTVVKDPTGTPTTAVLGTDYAVTHNTTYMTTTVQNISGGPLSFDVRVA